MKCDDAKARLIEWLYGELPHEEETRLREHLADCDSCRQVEESVRQCSRELKTLKEPDVRLDFQRLHRTAADRWQRSRRRWRRLAVAACAAALLVAILAGARLRFDWRPGQLTIGWGNVPRATGSVKPKPIVPAPPLPNDHEERIEILEEVAGLLSAELSKTDQRHAAATAELCRRLVRWQENMEQFTRNTDLRSQLAEKNVDDMYHLIQFNPDSSPEGAIP